MKNVAIVAFTDLVRDPRVRRHIECLKNNFTVTAFGLKDPEIEGVAFVKIAIGSYKETFIEKILYRVYLKIGFFERFYWRLQYRTLASLKVFPMFDMVIANDVETLPFVFCKFVNSKILFDAHEYSPREFEERPRWRFYFQKYTKYLCKKYIPRCVRMVTVSEGIAEEYYKVYNIKPTVITNASEYHEISPSSVSEDKVRIIHHGICNPSRGIELMIQLISYLDMRFYLDLMFVNFNTVNDYCKKLTEMINKNDRIKLINPVPEGQIIPFCSQYDIGLFLVKPVSFNLKYVLPNKLFEFIQARLAVAIGPSIEMAKIVKKYDCGVVSDTFRPDGLAKKINSLSKKEIEDYKRNTSKAAKEQNSEKNCRIIHNIINKHF